MTPTRSTPERVGGVLAGWTSRLPRGLRRWLTPSLVGFAILGGFTFGVDLALLWTLRRWTPLPVPIAVTASYVVAVALNYVLNRTMNFRSHAPILGEASRYTVVMALDYVLTVGVTTALTGLGLDLTAARLMAAAVVALLNYAAARWWIFRPPD
ncbi:GtrA family protein [Asanoa siamensis]|uniref:GtrA family protein n=1 Tax=Asanoa siamensis TaxID=926357 RepID=UPI0019423999|nr:GtrA family protein [Asanoa siamensis]